MSSIPRYLRLKPYGESFSENQRQSSEYLIEEIEPHKVKFKETEVATRFTSIFNEDATQDDLYKGVLEKSVADLFTGNDSVLFSLGPSNSGKSYTMFGDEANPGLAIHALNDILGKIDDKIMSFKPLKQLYGDTFLVSSSASNESRGDHALSLSVFEIYNDRIRDLTLDLSKTVHQSLEIITDHRDSKVKPNKLRQIFVTNLREANLVLSKSMKRRAVSSTKINSSSSRSHLFIYLNLHSQHGSIVKTTRLTVADLAGSERTKDARTDGKEFKEANYTNTSLTELGRVLNMMRNKAFDKSALRTSKLTRLLLTDLYGKGINGRVKLLLTIDPYATLGSILHCLKYIQPVARLAIPRASSSATERTPSMSTSTQFQSLNEEITALKSLVGELQAEKESMEAKLLETEVELRESIIEDYERRIKEMEITHSETLINLKGNTELDIDERLRLLSEEYESRIETKESELKEKDIELSQLTEQLEVAKLEYDSKASKSEGINRSLEEQNAGLLEKVNVLEDQLKLVTEQTENLKFESVNITTDYNTLMSQLEELRVESKNLRELLAEAEKLNIDKIAEIEKLNSDNSQLNNQIEEFNKELHSHNGKIKDLEHRYVVLSEEKSKIQTEYEESLAKYDLIVQDQDQMTSSNEDLKSQITELSNHKSSLQTTLEELKSQIATLEDEKETLNDENSQIRNNLKSLTIKKGELDLQNTELRVKIDNLTSELQNSMEIKDQLSIQLETLKTEITNASSSESNNALINQELKSKIDQLNDDLNAANSKVNHFNEKWVDATNAMELLEESKQALEVEIVNLKKKDADLNMQYFNEQKNHQQKIEEFESRIDQLMKEIVSLQTELDISKEELQAAESKVVDLEKNCFSTQEQLSTSESHRNSMKEEIDQARKSQEDLQTQTESANQRNIELQSTIESLQRELSIEKQKNSELMSNFVNVQQLDSLKLENSKLQDSLLYLTEESNKKDISIKTLETESASHCSLIKTLQSQLEESNNEKKRKTKDFSEIPAKRSKNMESSTDSQVEVNEEASSIKEAESFVDDIFIENPHEEEQGAKHFSESERESEPESEPENKDDSDYEDRESDKENNSNIEFSPLSKSPGKTSVKRSDFKFKVSLNPLNEESDNSREITTSPMKKIAPPLKKYNKVFSDRNRGTLSSPAKKKAFNPKSKTGGSSPLKKRDVSPKKSITTRKKKLSKNVNTDFEDSAF